MPVEYDTLTIHVHEMSKKQAMQFMASLSVYQDMGKLTDDIMEWERVKRTPMTVTYDGEPLGEGAHTVTLKSVAYDLPLPLTQEAYNALPFSLTTNLAFEVAEVNVWLTHFLAHGAEGLIRLRKTSASSSHNAPSNTPGV